MPAPASRVFTPAKIGPLELRNRTIRSAAFEGMAPGHRPSAALIAYHASVAAGGIGMTTVAYASVRRDGLGFPHQLWMREEIVPGLRRLTDAIHREGAAAAIQLGHCGNMATAAVSGDRPVAPSAVFNPFGLVLPKAMTDADIDDVILAFGRSVRLAREAGFDAVELQAGHGYLVSQFLSPLTNRRDDRWGGPLENRARLAVDVVREARKFAGSRMAIVVKTNVEDGFPGGMTADEGVETARMLEAAGADALVISGGFVSKCPMYVMRGETPLRDMVAYIDEPVRKVGLTLFGRLFVRDYPFEEAYFLRPALRIREAVRLPLVLVGGLRSLDSIDRAFDAGMDFVAMARALIREPDFVNRLRRGETRAARCEPCNRCMATMYSAQAMCLADANPRP